jgi:hypothetical protein
MNPAKEGRKKMAPPYFAYVMGIKIIKITLFGSNTNVSISTTKITSIIACYSQ